MLSVFDLLAAKTLDLDLAAYLMARISTGSFFMVGSVPAGAGKRANLRYQQRTKGAFQ